MNRTYHVQCIVAQKFSNMVDLVLAIMTMISAQSFQQRGEADTPFQVEQAGPRYFYCHMIHSIIMKETQEYNVK